MATEMEIADRCVRACVRLKDTRGWDYANRVSIRWVEWNVRKTHGRLLREVEARAARVGR